jgi:hypothetical protein
MSRLFAGKADPREQVFVRLRPLLIAWRRRGRGSGREDPRERLHLPLHRQPPPAIRALVGEALTVLRTEEGIQLRGGGDVSALLYIAPQVVGD